MISSHITGRAVSHQRQAVALPSNTDLLILFTDYLSHNVMRSYRGRAQAQGIRVLACRRSVSCLLNELRRLFGAGQNCMSCPLEGPNLSN